MSGKVLQPNDKGYPIRTLAVGFQHTLGDEDGSTRVAPYHWSQNNERKSWSWAPKSSTVGSLKARSDQGVQTATVGNVYSQREGEDTPSFEMVKKSIMPFVAYTSRGNWNRLSIKGRNPDGKNLETQARNIVWKKLNGGGGGKWANIGGEGGAPQEEAFGVMSDFLGRMREETRMKSDYLVGKLLISMMKDANVKIKDKNFKIGQKIDAQSAQEVALRLWPYVKEHMSKRGLDIRAFEKGMETFSERDPLRQTKFDIEKDMAIWKELKSMFKDRGNSIIGDSFDLQDYVEVTQQVNRVIGFSDKYDLDAEAGRRNLEKKIDDIITESLRQAWDKSGGTGRLSAAKDAGIGGQATRRLYDHGHGSSIKYTWIEPVQDKGIGLYNVFINRQGAINDATVAVSVSLLKGPTIGLFRALVNHQGANINYNLLIKKIRSAEKAAIFEHGKIDYDARFLGTKALKGAIQGGKVLKTRATIVTETELTEDIYEWATGLAYGIAAEAEIGQSPKFTAWSKIARQETYDWGQRQYENVANSGPNNFRSWVEDDLVKRRGPSMKGDKQKGSYFNSAPDFLKYLDKEAAYQPMPYAWMNAIGTPEAIRKRMEGEQYGGFGASKKY